MFLGELVRDWGLQVVLTCPGLFSLSNLFGFNHSSFKYLLCLFVVLFEFIYFFSGMTSSAFLNDIPVSMLW